eukprot:TRINITY_DN7996_c0_g1_i1.p1 TRINITY_DN7996_c0_g1~~TRINITY_DN7996_c0_g1_i1.p1  ORF type:complete len:1020 (-),score=227.50 TRINITY_DN7996_c0_g1_i1:170-3229(-)
MLFLGSQKYPSENEFAKYLSSHSGSDNAYTAAENTLYYFEIDQKYLHGALDIWAQFFIAPLFTESASGREVNAVNSENAKNLQNDLWRFDQLNRFLSNPEYPYHKFGTGNNKTLVQIPKEHGLNVQEELLKFHTKFYSANLMRLAILGRESLDTLEGWAQELFSVVPNHSEIEPSSSWNNATPFREQDLMIKVEAVSIKDEDYLYISYPLPSLRSMYYCKPAEYLSHLIGHEVNGTVLHLLKQNGWATSLSAGLDDDLSQFAVFRISVELTPVGFDNVDQIISLIYQYIRLINDTQGGGGGVSEWRYNEVKSTASIRFNYLEKMRSSTEVINLARSLSTKPKEHLLDGVYYYAHWNTTVEHTIREILNRLTVENSKVMVTSRKFEGKTDQIEEYYQTKYKLSPFTQQQIQLWKNSPSTPSLSLPYANEFIPTNFDIKPPPSTVQDIPEIVTEVKGKVKGWFHYDYLFKTPQSKLNFVFYTPSVYQDAESVVATQILLDMISDRATDFSYYAGIAGLHFSLQLRSDGIELTIDGYNHKQSLLFNKLVHLIFDEKTFNNNNNDTQNLFNLVKSSLQRSMQSALFELTYKIALSDFYESTLSPYWTFEERVNAIQFVTLETIQRIQKNIKSKLFVEYFGYGNLVKDDIIQIKQILEDTIFSSVQPTKSFYDTELIRPREIALRPGQSERIVHRNVTGTGSSNSAVITYFQADKYSLKYSALISLLQTILYEKAFNQLRTIEQLGYIVTTSPFDRNGACGFAVIVQSAVKDAGYLDNRVESFIQNVWRNDLYNMTNSSFGEYVQSAILQLSKLPVTLGEQSDREWSEIRNQQYKFKRNSIKVEKLKNLTLSDLESFSEIYFFGENTRKRLSIQIIGEPDVGVTQPEFNQHEVTSVLSFKRNSGLYPQLDSSSPIEVDPVYPLINAPVCPPSSTPTSTPSSYPVSPLTPTPSRNTPSDSKPEMSNTEVISIAVGLLGAMLVLGAFVFYCYRKYESSKEHQKVTSVSDEEEDMLPNQSFAEEDIE